MADLDILKDAVDRSTTFWRQGQHADALKLLDQCIEKAQQEKRGTWVKVLCMHASLISDSMGDLRLAKQYCEEILADEPQNALALYTLADILFREGETHLAKENAAKSYSLVAHSNLKEDRGILELLVQRWPQISEWPG